MEQSVIRDFKFPALRCAPYGLQALSPLPFKREAGRDLFTLHRHKEFVVGFEIFQLVEQEFSCRNVFHVV